MQHIIFNTFSMLSENDMDKPLARSQLWLNRMEPLHLILFSLEVEMSSSKFKMMYRDGSGEGPCEFRIITSKTLSTMLETNLTFLWDIGGCLGGFRHQHPPSFNFSVGHQHSEDVTNMETLSPTHICDQNVCTKMYVIIHTVCWLIN